MYFVQTWHGLADEAVKDAVNDLQALRNVMRIVFYQYQRKPTPLR